MAAKLGAGQEAALPRDTRLARRRLADAASAGGWLASGDIKKSPYGFKFFIFSLLPFIGPPLLVR